MEANHAIGYWFRVKLPQGAAPGSNFVVNFPQGYKTQYVLCTVPQTDLLKPDSNSCSCTSMERGGGIDEILVSYVDPGTNRDTNEPYPTAIVQALRVKKDNPMNCFLYLLPIPYLCIMYPLYWTDIGSNGCCEELDGMEWTHTIQHSEIGEMKVVKAVKWDRQVCTHGGEDMNYY